MSFQKLFVLLLLSAVWGACVDVPSGPGTDVNPNFRSLARFVHAISGAAPGALTIDGAAVGNLTFPGSSAYLDVASGSRNLSFAGSAAQTITFLSEEQSTVLIYAPTAGTIAYLNMNEGRSDRNNGTAGVARIRFANVALGSAPNLSLRDSGADSVLSANVAFASTPQYREVSPGARTLSATSVGTYTATLNGGNEIPSVSTFATGSATVTLNEANGVSFSVDVKADNRQGFFTAAHFHNAPADSNGGIVFPLTDTVYAHQQIGIPEVTLSGANEVPSVSSSATGTGTFTLTRAGLSYSIEVAPDSVDTLFTLAHFHHAAAGANGGVWHNIRLTPFGATTLTGLWEGAAIGDTLTELLAGNIYVNAHSASHPGGIIRAQLVPDSATTSTYAGTWNDSTLTATLKEEFNNGRIYLNFHTAGNPGGQIRGQVVPTGKFGVASLPSTTYEAGKMYTIVATGAGSSFQIVKFDDREFGVAKQLISRTVRDTKAKE